MTLRERIYIYSRFKYQIALLSYLYKIAGNDFEKHSKALKTLSMIDFKEFARLNVNNENYIKYIQNYIWS